VREQPQAFESAFATFALALSLRLIIRSKLRLTSARLRLIAMVLAGALLIGLAVAARDAENEKATAHTISTAGFTKFVGFREVISVPPFGLMRYPK
jgi:hypothetical protein